MWPQQIESDRLSPGLPYDKDKAPLDSSPRYVDGENFYVTSGGSLDKRPGTSEIELTKHTDRIFRCWQYETLDGAVYIMASFRNGDGTYSLKYIRLGAASAAWTNVPELRSLHKAIYPHHGITVKGKFYVLYVPKYTTGDKIGAIVFDGARALTTPKSYWWGVLRPSVPAKIKGSFAKLTKDIKASDTTLDVDDNTTLPTTPFIAWIGLECINVTAKVSTDKLTVTRGHQNTTADAHVKNNKVIYKNFPDSANKVEITFGWKYFYCYKTNLGQISSISDYDFNPSHLGSDTGPFLNQKPVIIVRGHADITNIPKIVLCRTPDGGGTPFILREVDNPGDIDVEIIDDRQESDSGFEDPTNDGNLQDLAPTTTSNDPPPQVPTSKVVGYDYPLPSTRLISYASRIWYGIDNEVKYSANEDINEGIPEHCFPSSKVRGNFYEMASRVNNIQDGKDAIYIITATKTTVITGATKDMFVPRDLFNQIGAPIGQEDSSCKLNQDVAWLTQDFRLILVPAQSEISVTISGPLESTLKDLVTSQGMNISLVPYTNQNDQWLIVNCANYLTPQNSRQYVMDINRFTTKGEIFWFTPWTIRSTAVLSDRINESEVVSKLVFPTFTNQVDTTATQGKLVYLDPNVASDALPTSGSLGYACFADTHQMTVPTGNSHNSTTAPSVISPPKSLTLERLRYDNDEPIRVYYFINDLWSNPKEAIYKGQPVKLKESYGYAIAIYDIDQATNRVAFRILVARNTVKTSIQSITPNWQIAVRSSLA